MTQDEILEALHKVVAENTHYTTWTVSTPHLVLLVNLAIEQEREACAKVCDDHCGWTPRMIGETIRARGNHDTR
jgi:bacteriorhodopsin